MVTRHGMRLERAVIERDYVFGGMNLMFFFSLLFTLQKLGKGCFSTCIFAFAFFLFLFFPSLRSMGSKGGRGSLIKLISMAMLGKTDSRFGLWLGEDGFVCGVSWLTKWERSGCHMDGCIMK